MLTEKKLTFIDLFAGIGGFRLALESFGLKCTFSSESNKYAQQTYQANFGETPHGDITKIKSEEISRHDVLCAGFPCQAFSISGKRLGFEDTRGTLFFEIARITKYHQPKILFLENVKNFAGHDKGKTLQTVEQILENLGYKVFYKVLNASNFELPTARERIYILGFRKDLGIDKFNFPVGSEKNTVLRDFLELEKQNSNYVIERDDITFLRKSNNQIENYPQKPVRIGVINKGGQGERIYDINGHAITLSANGGGAASKTGAYLINGKVRKLTPRECANIMGFPNDFKIPVSDAQAYKQFGNSVAIPVVKAIFKRVLETIGEKNERKYFEQSRFANS